MVHAGSFVGVYAIQPDPKRKNLEIFETQVMFTVTPHRACPFLQCQCKAHDWPIWLYTKIYATG